MSTTNSQTALSVKNALSKDYAIMELDNAVDFLDTLISEINTLSKTESIQSDCKKASEKLSKIRTKLETEKDKIKKELAQLRPSKPNNVSATENKNKVETKSNESKQHAELNKRTEKIALMSLITSHRRRYEATVCVDETMRKRVLKELEAFYLDMAKDYLQTNLKRVEKKTEKKTKADSESDATPSTTARPRVNSQGEPIPELPPRPRPKSDGAPTTTTAQSSTRVSQESNASGHRRTKSQAERVNELAMRMMKFSPPAQVRHPLSIEEIREQRCSEALKDVVILDDAKKPASSHSRKKSGNS